jgi:hypothetical protein
MPVSKVILQVCEDQTNILTATRQFDGCELLFVVLLECRTELRDECGAFDREGFDICYDRFRIGASALEDRGVPAITSASLGLVSSSPLH